MSSSRGGLAGAFGKTLMTTVGITAISFISSVLTARMLGPEGRGLLSAALMVGTLAAGVAQLGLATSYVYHVGAARRFSYGGLLSASVLMVALVAAAMGWIGAQLRSDPQFVAALPWVIALAAFMGTQNYFFLLAQIKSDLRFFNLMRFSLVGGNLLLLLPLLLFYHTVQFMQMLYCQLAVVVALTLVGAYWSMQNRVWNVVQPKEPVSLLRVLRYGLQQHGTVLLSLLLLNFDKIILLQRGQIAEYGYYAMAFTTSRLIGAVQEAVAVALYARFAGRDLQQLDDKVRTAFRLTFVPLLLLAALGATLSHWLIVLVYGEKFAPMALPFAILLFECVCGGASWTLAQRFTAGGRPGLVLVRQLISVVPVFIAMPFLPAGNVYVFLALLMLLGAVLRLVVTLCMYPITLKEKMPALLPTRADLQMLYGLLPRARGSLN
jgi:O-antigen/teichoic acid export membrane protein